MNRLNILFTLSSISVLLVTIERFSFTTKVFLQPYNFLRLHEVIQMSVLILITIIIPFYLLTEVTNRFKSVSTNKNVLLILLFVVGIYFYATGNGIHEVSSFNLNNFCDTKKVSGELCLGFFVNDYYTGNILYFIGGILMTVPLLLFEKESPNTKFKKSDFVVLVINALIYAFAIFAYAAFDTVLVGLAYSLILMVISLSFFIGIQKKYFQYPIITYTAITYTVATITASIIRLVHH